MGTEPVVKYRWNLHGERVYLDRLTLSEAVHLTEEFLRVVNIDVNIAVGKLV